ncbi:hypothetical protein PGTUg99_012742 [Puccinia graminis f. sp. tritici]|uniref:Uncharacterized protein n=1 Tax=Puccinia graminis f. sp. tritici TaxID=56615 RepID=A0A5B0RZG7_PUCGR|nr:hypothetical protein PGTUg99_012742 [Puccinia graminis f. sp. tritici]
MDNGSECVEGRAFVDDDVDPDEVCLDKADSPPTDHELEDEKAESLADQNQKTLMQLLTDLYEFHPPHTSSIPIYTRGKTYRNKAANNKSKTDESTDPKNEQELDFGLNWEFVLGVASSTTFDIKESGILYRISTQRSSPSNTTSPPFFQISDDAAAIDQRSVGSPDVTIVHFSLVASSQGLRGYLLN